jgi:hypothetical protein
MRRYTERANAAGVATVTITPDVAGIQWTVAQVGAETQPVRTTATVVTRLNGAYVTSSAILPSSAGGQPFFNLTHSDKMTMEFAGLTLNDVGVVSVYYKESPDGTVPTGDVV